MHKAMLRAAFVRTRSGLRPGLPGLPAFVRLRSSKSQKRKPLQKRHGLQSGQQPGQQSDPHLGPQSGHVRLCGSKSKNPKVFKTRYKNLSSSPFLVPDQTQAEGAPPAFLSLDQCHAYFQSEVRSWSTNDRTLRRFARFGYDASAIRPFLDVFVSAVQSGFFASPERFTKYQLTRFTSCGAAHAGGLQHAASKPHLRLLDAEITFSNIFFSWIANSHDSAPLLEEAVTDGRASSHTLDALRHLAIVSERRPSEHFTWARKSKRNFIIHVGPTNSGKTHHALRALAAARSGVYAGPLRLLAYEIWERLNLGQIIPLGVDVPSPSSAPPSSKSNLNSITDRLIAPQAMINSNPTYARPTNMITGEERKIVDDDASLQTCTIEMLSYRHQYDVGVIDEIQMIGDPERGFAWTDAVLGLCAKEIHLCGEESALPVIRQLLQETGDNLTVKRYERLTPLSVEKHSLDGDLSQVVKGDCVVAFARSRIFEIKRQIESLSGLRCAVVYGKLPPEIRSEQAALFNDPTSGFDVIIGSDAIGMGLNLYVDFFLFFLFSYLYIGIDFTAAFPFRKIRRIIFDSVCKPSPERVKRPLTVSQIKQIAGRAGRYGHSLVGEKPGGFVTTLNPEDLLAVQEALSLPSTPTLTHAYIGPTFESLAVIAPALSHSSSHKLVDLETAQMAHVYTTLPPSSVYKHCYRAQLSEVCTWVETQSQGQFTWEDKLKLMFTPIPWRDEMGLRAAEEMAALQREEMCVLIEKMKAVVGNGKKKGLLGALEAMELKISEVEKMRGREREREGKEGEMRKDFPQNYLSPFLPLLESRPSPSSESRPSPSSENPPSPSPSSSLDFSAQPSTTHIRQELLEQLEALHKILVMYMWSHFKNSVVYPDRDIAESLKSRVEVALDWGLREVGRDAVRVKRPRQKGSKRWLEKEEEDSSGTFEWEEEVQKNRKGEKEKRMKRKGSRRESEETAPFFGLRSAEVYQAGLKSFEDRRSSSSSPPPPPPFPALFMGASQSQLGGIESSSTSSTSLSSPYYPPPAAVGSTTMRSSGVASAIMNMRNLKNENVVQSARWKQAPDLTALLKMYVDSPSLRADGGGGRDGGGNGGGSGGEDVRK